MRWHSSSVGYTTVCFFFQAEDGIRDYKVTGVQTCALPILVREDVGRRDREAVLVDKPLAPGARQLRELRPNLLDPSPIDVERDEIGFREVSIVVRVLFRAHRARDLAVRVPEPCLLHDVLTHCERRRLTNHFELQSPLDVPERVQILDLDLRPERGAPPRTQRDVGVAPERALLHVAVADPEVDQYLAEGPQVRGGLFWGSELRPRHRLHERHAGTVEVHEARLGRRERALVQELADVLLEVEALDSDAPRRTVDLDVEKPVFGERLFILADLVVLRHVRVVVVLSRKAAPGVHAAVERQRGPDSKLDRPPVDDR